MAFLEKGKGVLCALACVENLTTPLTKGVKLRVPACSVCMRSRSISKSV